MKKNDLVKGNRQKICLMFEKFVIYSFFAMTIVELIFLINLISFYKHKSNLYFYNLMEKRLVIKSYIGSLNPVSKKDFKDNGYHCIEKEAVPHSILNLETFSDITLNNITEKVMIADYHKNSKSGVIDLFKANYNFYDIDIGKKNTSKVKLATTYQFVNWRTYYMCAFKINLENDAIMFFPKDKSCSDLGENIYECGVYYNTYKICVNANKLIINSKRASDLILKGNYNKEEICPYNYINFDFKAMKQNSDIPIDNFSTRYRKNKVPSNRQDLKNKVLLIDTDNINLGNVQKINKAEDQIFFDRPKYNYQYDVSIGYHDSLNDILDSYPLYEFYNDTFYNSSVRNKLTNESSYDPNYMSGEHGKDFYKIIDSSDEKINITFSTYNFKAFSIECFNNLLKDKGEYQYNFFKLIHDNSTTFLNRTFYYMFAWNLTKLILSYYWDIKIRLFYIKNLLANSLNEADQNAEYITKITGKTFIGAIYGILIYGTIFHKISFMKIQTNSNNLYNYKCFSDDLINSAIKRYIEYVSDMDSYNFNLFIMFFISGGLQGFLLTYYILDLIWAKTQEKLLSFKYNNPKNEENLLVKKDA